MDDNSASLLHFGTDDEPLPFYEREKRFKVFYEHQRKETLKQAEEMKRVINRFLNTQKEGLKKARISDASPASKPSSTLRPSVVRQAPQAKNHRAARNVQLQNAENTRTRMPILPQATGRAESQNAPHSVSPTLHVEKNSGILERISPIDAENPLLNISERGSETGDVKQGSF